jgi:hypothetical protein
VFPLLALKPLERLYRPGQGYDLALCGFKLLAVFGYVLL